MASLDHLNMTVHHLPTSLAWYEKLFGFKKVEGEDSGPYGPWAILRSEDSMLCLYEDPERIPPHTDKDAEKKFHQISHFGIRIRDREKWEETIKRESLKVDHGGAWRYPHSHSWYIDDPSGYRIEVAYWDQDQVKF